MPKSKFIDFRRIKEAITMEQVLEHYGLLKTLTRNGDNLTGPCPIHKGNNQRQFKVSLSKNIWNCFSECKHGGNTLDFIVRMENVSIHSAALKAIEWFQLDIEALGAGHINGQDEPVGVLTVAADHPEQQEQVEIHPSTPNKPLKFRLDKLEREHPYLRERGLSLETVIDFGVGFCSKGLMANRIAIPIHRDDGVIMGYAGRHPGSPDDKTPKYKLPPSFSIAHEVFNIDRAIKEPPDLPWVIAQGFFDCMRLHQNGCRKVVGLMGTSMSPTQEQIIRKHINKRSRIVVLLNETDKGRAARLNIASRLCRHCFVFVHEFEKPGAESEQLSPSEVQMIGGLA